MTAKLKTPMAELRLLGALDTGASNKQVAAGEDVFDLDLIMKYHNERPDPNSLRKRNHECDKQPAVLQPTGKRALAFRGAAKSALYICEGPTL